MHHLRITAFILAFFAFAMTAYAEPTDVSSPDLRPIKVKPERAMGRILVQVNFSSHHIKVDGAEYPAYLADYGIEVTSNELHEIVVSNSAGAEKKYKLSVNPHETMMLYVDLGSEKKADEKKEEDKKEDKKKDDASTGFLTITAETEAQIYIDGKLVSSKTPLKKHEVSTGSHTVRVYFFDTRKFSKSREIYVGKGATMSMNFTKD